MHLIYKKSKKMASIQEFTVGNFMSFCEKHTLLLKPKGIAQHAEANIVSNKYFPVLKSAAIYGANSSGKTNLLNAIAMMCNIIYESIKLNDGEKLPYIPFLLQTGMEERPTHFEIVIAENERRIRYGFEYTLSRIESEWFFMKTREGEERAYFLRDSEGIGVNDKLFSEGSGLESKTNDNRLFLSLVSQLGGALSNYLMSLFIGGINVISGLSSKGYESFTKKSFLSNDELSAKAMQFFTDLQFGFNRVVAKKIDIDSQNYTIDINTVHKRYDENGNIVGDVAFLLNQESAGTLKMFDMAGPIFDTLERGCVLVIDELDAKMHPLISEKIIEIFNSKDKNPNNAQLIFTTHDTHLLSSKLLRRDQIWLTEKDQQERTDLYSLMDVVFPDGSKPRDDANLEKNYIAGRYGAIPYIHNI